MDTLDFSLLAALISVLAAVSGIVLGWTAHSRGKKTDVKADAESSAVLRADLDYIRRAVDDIRLEQRAQKTMLDALAERVTRLEESSKQAHRRIDRMDGKGGGSDGAQ